MRKNKKDLFRKMHFNIDTDRDGVPDWKDCRPFNPFKQHSRPAYPAYCQRTNESDEEWTNRIFKTVNSNALKKVNSDSFFFRTMVTAKSSLERKNYDYHTALSAGPPPQQYVVDKKTKTRMKINYNVISPVNRRVISIYDSKNDVYGYSDIIGTPILLFLMTGLDKEKLGPLFYPFLMNVLQYNLHKRMSR